MEASAALNLRFQRPTLPKRITASEAKSSAGSLIISLLPVIVLMAGFSLDNVPVQLLSGLLLAIVIFSQPRLGLFAIVIALGNDAVDYDPLTEPFMKLLQPLHGLLATPIEVLVGITVAAWLIRGGTRYLPNRTVMNAALLLEALLLVTIAHGVFNGGDFTTALWESRAALLVMPCIFLSAGLLTERRHVYEFVYVLLGTLSLMTIELTWRYFAVVKDGGYDGVLEQAFNHDGAMLVAGLFVLAASFFLWGGKGKNRFVFLAIMMLAIFIVLTSRRRASVIGAESAILVLGIMLAVTRWRVFIKWLPVVLVITAVYCAAFWKSTSVIGQPVRGFQSVFQSQNVSARDKESDDYRIAERADAWINIKQQPLIGSGFGLAYAKPVKLTDLSKFWPFWAYIPHNNVLWLWMKGGILLFVAFWFLLGAAVSQAASVAKRAKEDFPIALSVAFCAYFVMVILMAYVDLGLQSARLMMLFGCGIGLLTVLERLWVLDAPELAAAAKKERVEPAKRLVAYRRPGRAEVLSRD